jgi:hypothetical protein
MTKRIWLIGWLVAMSHIGGVMTKRIWLIGWLVAMSASVPATAIGQNDPRQILRSVIQQVQTGTLNPGWYGLQLWQIIAYQTGGSGVYPQLVQLGTVSDVTITAQLPLPTGMVYAMSVRHAHGQSYWEFGISSLTNRIEYASFLAGPGSGPISIPGADEPPQEPKPLPRPVPPANPGGKSEACKKFPNLC